MAPLKNPTFQTDVQADSNQTQKSRLRYRPTTLSKNNMRIEPGSTSATASGISATTSTDSADTIELVNQPTVPLFDYEAMKKAARFASTNLSRRQLPVPVETLSQSEKLGRNIAKGARPDCTTEHANLGLLAIPFLIADTLTDTGCKW